MQTIFRPSPEPRFALRHVPTSLSLALVTRLDGFWRKGRGVIGMPALPPGAGVWLPGVDAVHTFFVASPLDIVFLDGELRMLAAYPSVPPWRPLVWARGARHTLELGAGTLAALTGSAVEVGDLWELHRE